MRVFVSLGSAVLEALIPLSLKVLSHVSQYRGRDTFMAPLYDGGLGKVHCRCLAWGLLRLVPRYLTGDWCVRVCARVARVCVSLRAYVCVCVRWGLRVCMRVCVLRLHSKVIKCYILLRPHLYTLRPMTH